MKKKLISVILCAAVLALCAAVKIPAAQAGDGEPVYESAESQYECGACGDVDGDGKISAGDSRLALRNGVGLEILSAKQELAADIDTDGMVTAADARLILRAAVGLERLPGHTALESVTVTPATCFESGVCADLCARCGRLFNYGRIPSIGHLAIEWETTDEPTCLQKGLAQQKCLYCGTIISTKLLDKTSHNFGRIHYETAPSCTLYVNTYRECSVCGYKEYSTEAPIGSHSYGWTTVREATCTEDGLMKQVCAHCGLESGLTKPITAPGSHNEPKEWRTAEYATCTENGLRVKTCLRCKQLCASEVIPATGHTPQEGTYNELTPAGCTEDGKAEFFCAGCSKTVEEILPATGHTPANEPVTVQPTCTADGSITYSCKSCGGAVSEKIPATGHTPESWEDAEACSDENGEYLVRRCVVCREEVQRYRIDDNM